MNLLKLQLANFRNMKNVVFEFTPHVNAIVGPNAVGKTNIIESAFLLATGKSFRARIEEEMISYEADIARVKGSIVDESEGVRVGTNLEIVLTRGEISVATSEKVRKVAKKKLLINGISKRLIDFAGSFRVVLFGPWDLDLVTASPSIRRNFLDTVLSQTDREYRRAIVSYGKGLRQRNKLLLRIREEGVSRSQLLFWNKLLIKNGDYISQKRDEFIGFANNTKALSDQAFTLTYDKSAISESRLEQYKDEEVAAATTLVGPHRDDFIFMNQTENSKTLTDLARYGSRGEQRMGVLWLKIAELSFVKEKTYSLPTLLLDDIFSELDHEHREIVINTAQKQQTIISTADPHFIESTKKVEKIYLKG